MSVDPALVASALAVAAGAMLQATGGIGFAMFAAPIVALLRPDLVPGPMVFGGGAVSLLILLREHRSIDVRAAAIAVGGRIPGAIVAGLLIGLAPRSLFAVCFAVMILAAVVLSVCGWRVRATPAALAVAGFSSGVMGTLTGVGAPPIGIVLQNSAPAVLRATLAAFLVAGSVASLTVLWWVGRFGAHELAMSALLLVPVALGFVLSAPLVSRVNARSAKRLVLAVSAGSALVLLVQQATH